MDLAGPTPDFIAIKHPGLMAIKPEGKGYSLPTWA